MLGRERLRMIARTAGPPTLCLLILGCGQHIMTPMAARRWRRPRTCWTKSQRRGNRRRHPRARQLQSGIGQPRRLYRGSGRRPQSRRHLPDRDAGIRDAGLRRSGAFRLFQRQIQSNGVVEMDWGRNSVIGRFDGPHFVGRWIAPACSYELTLNWEG